MLPLKQIVHFSLDNCLKYLKFYNFLCTFAPSTVKQTLYQLSAGRQIFKRSHFRHKNISLKKTEEKYVTYVGRDEFQVYKNYRVWYVSAHTLIPDFKFHSIIHFPLKVSG